MAIDLLNPLDPTSPTFRSDVNAFFAGGLNNAIAQMNATHAGMSELAAGGAYAFQYTFDSATADADPGAGKLRLSSATQSSATSLRIDVLAQGGVSLAAVFDTVQGVTSAIKGSVRIVKEVDPAKWLLFDISSVGSGAGYRNMTLAYRAGSSANPFVNGDALMVFIDRNGDAGSIAPGSTVLLSSIVVSSPVAAINALNIFSSAYDYYIVEVDNLTFSNVQGPRVQFAVGGVLDTSQNYASSAGTSRSEANSAAMFFGSTRDRITGVMEFMNVNGNTPPVWIYRGSYYSSSLVGSSPYGTESGSGLLNKNVIATGFAITPNGNNTITGGTIRIYGVRNS